MYFSLPNVMYTDTKNIIIIFDNAANLVPFAVFTLCEVSAVLFVEASCFCGTLKPCV